MIIGSFPIRKFTDPKRQHEIRPQEMDFYYGGEKNQLWKILAEIYETPLESRAQVKRFLKTHKIAMGDVIRSCYRKDGGSSDKDLKEIEWNTELYSVLKQKKIYKVFFTSQFVARNFERLFPQSQDISKKILISPSAQSYRSLGKNPAFQAWREIHPQRSMREFILESYRKNFETKS